MPTTRVCKGRSVMAPGASRRRQRHARLGFVLELFLPLFVLTDEVIELAAHSPALHPDARAEEEQGGFLFVPGADAGFVEPLGRASCDGRFDTRFALGRELRVSLDLADQRLRQFGFLRDGHELGQPIGFGQVHQLVGDLPYVGRRPWDHHFNRRNNRDSNFTVARRRNRISRRSNRSVQARGRQRRRFNQLGRLSARRGFAVGIGFAPFFNALGCIGGKTKFAFSAGGIASKRRDTLLCRNRSGSISRFTWRRAWRHCWSRAASRRCSAVGRFIIFRHKVWFTARLPAARVSYGVVWDRSAATAAF